MKKALFIILSGLFVTACSKSGNAPAAYCSGAAKSFSTDVHPIIQTSCATDAGCHGTGSQNGPGPLLTYNHVFNARTAIRTAVGNGSMPKTGSLSTSQRNAILCWIDGGSATN